MISALGWAIPQVIEAITSRPVVVTQTVCVPALDKSGEAIRDASGNPVMEWITEEKLESRKAAYAHSGVSVDFNLKGIRLSAGSQSA